MRYMQQIVTTLFILLLAFNTSAEEVKKPRLYNVEVIVFSQTLGQNTNEQWQLIEQDVEFSDQNTDPKRPSVNSAQIIPQKKASFELTPIAYTLTKRNNAYRLLSHKKWQQRMYKKPGKLPVAYEIDTINGVLTGTIEVSAQRFLHAHIDLTLAKDSMIIPFKEKRKMRRDEVHYIDHPLLGIIIKTSRVENEEE